MGCDIHMICEFRWLGKWFMKSEPFFVSCYDEELTISPYDGRNYTLFGILAEVRSDEYEPIDVPRGLPMDMSEFAREYMDEHRDWCHSFSWLSLRDLEEYDWRATRGIMGLLTPVQYKQYLDTGEIPKIIPTDVANASDLSILDEEELGDGVEDFTEYDLIYCQLKSEGTIDECEWFLNYTMPKLRELRDAVNGTDDDIRILFCFDN